MAVSHRVTGVARNNRRVRTRIQFAVLLFAWDGVLLVMGIAQVFGLADMTEAGIELFSTSYGLDTPMFPWALSALAALSIVAGWSAIQLRRFTFVMVVALIWTGLGVAALTIGPGLLIERLLLVAALARGRSAFLD